MDQGDKKPGEDIQPTNSQNGTTNNASKVRFLGWRMRFFNLASHFLFTLFELSRL